MKAAVFEKGTVALRVLRLLCGFPACHGWAQPVRLALDTPVYVYLPCVNAAWKRPKDAQRSQFRGYLGWL